ncbi:hypothetical protein QE385_003429 [Sphingomonas sp. SORGH_AS 950]|uniref:hypothetical protein n=1 Tax=Sphingomonas sp. SORGH_AS_0950 TaxID=3041792 RepID=UPI002788DDCC|nr:hypothetical protein [Sphingomonas sp. SORGH_AS_0950]MDQ1159102.1 hypothetical protein [Sphingomonas sp. SORGH_AS_0950]
MNDSIDDRALDSVSVAPGGDKAEQGNRPRPPEQDAGQDPDITGNLAKNPEDVDAQLDESLDESMDASDPPSNTQPGRDGPAESSGYTEEDR